MKALRKYFLFIFALIYGAVVSRPMDYPAYAAELPIADAKNVELVGHVGGITNAVAVQGNYAYIGVGPRLLI
jgi:hypothetical protein